MHDDRSMSERMTAIETIVMRLEKELLGNGQPGKIKELETRIDAIEQRWIFGPLLKAALVVVGAALFYLVQLVALHPQVAATKP